MMSQNLSDREKKLVAALRGLFDCEALEMYRRDDNPAWDEPEVAAAREALASYPEPPQ